MATFIGVFALIVVLGVMNGFNRNIREKLLASEAHLRVSLPSVEKTNDYTIEKKVEEILGSKVFGSERLSFSPFLQQDVIIKTNDGRFSGAQIKAMPKAEIRKFLARIWSAKNGNVPMPEYMEDMANLEDREILIGGDLANELRVYDGEEILLVAPDSLLKPVGESFGFEKIRIRSTVITDLADIDGQFIFLSSDTLAYRFLSKNVFTKGYEIRLANADAADSLKIKLQEVLSSVDGITIETWADRNAALFYALKLEKGAMTTLLALSILITTFSLITVLILLISQKRREVGVLMALGLSSYQAVRMFLGIGIFLSGFGLFLGLVLGVLVSFLIEKFPIAVLPAFYYDSAIPSKVEWTSIFLITGMCVFMALFSALLPVTLYLKKNASDNLRPIVAD